jgi:predicted GH43/DUF377 family glycosyl hydrolase
VLTRILNKAAKHLLPLDIYRAFKNIYLSMDRALAAIADYLSVHYFSDIYLWFVFPMVNAKNCHVFAGPGYLGFKGGLFNPGSIHYKSKILVIAKAQVKHWTITVLKDKEKFTYGPPVLFYFDKRLDVEKSHILNKFDGLPEAPDIVEDFRMFDYGRRIYLNHPVVLDHSVTKEGAIVRTISQAISEVEPENNAVRFVGYPKTDLRLRQIEKNWVYFEHNGELYIHYSFSPYIVLKLQDWGNLIFSTVIYRDVEKFFCPMGFNKFVSLGTNPISYDHEHYLLLIHRFRRTRKRIGRVYLHWAVLIDKQTLLPVKITRKPVFKGGHYRGFFRGVIYPTSILRSDDYFLFFNGEGDSHLSYTKIKKETLDKEFINFRWLKRE